jgi:DNA-directed RNA polymerase specialized sigma24 family protein
MYGEIQAFARSDPFKSSVAPDPGDASTDANEARTLNNGSPPGSSPPAEPSAGPVERDRPALAVVYRDHAGAIYALARYLCGAELGAEVTHRVFVAWWRDGAAIDVSPRSLRTTLLTLAHQHARDLLPQQRPAAGSGIGGVEHLPEIERDAIATALLGQCSYRDAAAILGQPVDSVRSRIRAGLHRLHPIAGADLNRS